MSPPLQLPVKFLRSATAGRRPGDGSFRALTDGEFFVNTADVVLCFLNAQGGLVTFALTQALYALLASPAFTGTPTAPTAAAGDSSTKLATTGFVTGALGGYAPLASPAFTGTPTAPTAAAGDSSTKVATTAFATALYNALAAQQQADETAIANRLRGDAAGSYSAAVQDQFRANLLGAVPLSVTNGQTVNLTILDTDRDVFATGTATVTAANGGIGWRSGEIRNDNAVSGLIALAVPSGATLDGVTNGTQLLFPYQVARLRQVGANSYRVQWVVRRPTLRTYAYGGPIAYWDFVLPVGYQRFRLLCSRLFPNASGGALAGYLSLDGGSTFQVAANAYSYSYVLGNSAGVSAGGSTSSYMQMTSALLTSNSNFKASVEFTLDPGDGSDRPNYTSLVNYLDTNSNQDVLTYTGQCVAVTTRPNFLRVQFANGATQGYGQFTLIGEA